MRLTKKELSLILRNLRVSIPSEMRRELLDQYGALAVDDEGHVFEYTEQDISEQLRKKLRSFQSVNNEEVRSLS